MMNRRNLLKIAAFSAGHMIVARNMNSQAHVRRQIGCAFRSDQLAGYSSQIAKLPVVEIEDWLDPTFPERAQEAVPVIQQILKGYGGGILLSGPFIDLNPGSTERLIQKATRQRFEECYRFANAIGAREIIFLSSYIPIINLSFYDQGWLSNSVAFWRSFLEGVERQVTVSLCNTCEYHTSLMLKLVEEVERPNFRLAFDLGHFLVYGREPLVDWLAVTASHISSVYIHSNNGRVDTHDEPGQGVLTCKQFSDVVAAVRPNVNLILKMSKKETLEKSVAWLEAC